MNRIQLIFVGLAGGLLSAGGVMSLALYAAAGLITDPQTDPAASAAEFAVLGVLGLALGLALIWHATRAWHDDPSAVARLPVLLAFAALLVFPLVITSGRTLLDAPAARTYVFPWLHLLSVVLPGLAALALVETAGRRHARPVLAFPAGGMAGRDSRSDPGALGLLRLILDAPTWRRVLGALAWGLAGASAIAMVLELGAVLVALVAVVAFFGATGQADQLQQWLVVLRGEDTGLSSGGDLFANPLVVAVLLLGTAVVVPLIEESAKSLVVVFLRRRLASARDAFIYGAAAGIGFGMLEATLYSVANLADWPSTATLRVGATFTHALATGLVGVGWYTALLERRRGRGLAWGLAGCAVHGLWNAVAVLLMAISAATGVNIDPATLANASDPAGWLLAGLPLLLASGAVVALILVPWRLARAGEPGPLGRPPVPGTVVRVEPALSAADEPARRTEGAPVPLIER